MFCPNCGKTNPDQAATCDQCRTSLRTDTPPTQSYGTPPQDVPNYLVHAILVTIFCCLPFGIVAIVYAAGVNGRFQAGDVAGAVQASNNAKKWCWIALVCGLAMIALWFMLGVLGMVAGVSEV